MARETEIFKTSFELMDQYIQKCRDFMNGWLLFNQLLSGYVLPGVDRTQYEARFLEVKSTLAREHGVLKERLGPDFRFSPDVLDVIFSSTTLEAVYAQSEVAVKKLQSNWHRAYISINETLGALEDKRSRAEAGERVSIGRVTFHIKKSKPIPKRKMAIGSAAFVAFGCLVFSLYFMRVFLGFWAPATGEGMVVTKDMTDDERIQVLLVVLKEAVEAQDIDRIMTTISDQYADAAGRHKTETRVLLQGLKTSGRMENIKFDIANKQIAMQGDKADVTGITLTVAEGSVTVTLGVGREGDKWMVTSITGL